MTEQVSMLTHNSEDPFEPNGTIPTFTHNDILTREWGFTLVRQRGCGQIVSIWAHSEKQYPRVGTWG